jgi:Probable zinc-ribbon domain
MVTERKRRAARRGPPAGEEVRVNESALAPYNSYGDPEFVRAGHYSDRPFRCRDCGKDEVWTARQQKWWYEVAKGYVYSTAVRCRACRRKAKS